MIVCCCSDCVSGFYVGSLFRVVVLGILSSFAEEEGAGFFTSLFLLASCCPCSVSHPHARWLWNFLFILAFRTYILA